VIVRTILFKKMHRIILYLYKKQRNAICTESFF